MLSHMVYFTLNDSSDEACQKLMDACREYLKPHADMVFFGVGKRDPELDRPVNDTEFHIALNTVFATREAHDAYQISPKHLAFIAANKENWKNVRVFDAVVAE